MRYVNDDDVLKVIERFIGYLDEDMIERIKMKISAIPTAEERPHGEWIPFEWDSNYKTKIPLPKGSDSHMEEYWDEEFMCSVCGKAHHARNFCPNCGADMREEGESN
ncbi:MAG: hypothetical protein IIY21_09005 [Clostridiales bacterium]|nr:hypothetical protein [Clostridiales bacterium]